MANLVLKGLVLRAADYQESSKILTVLTDARGKITVSAKGALRRSSRIAAASQPFAYAEMTLSESRDRYYLNEAGKNEIELKGTSRIIPDTWSYHVLSYDCETGILEYVVNGITEDLTYIIETLLQI